MKVGDVVWFQAYKSNEPVRGKIKRIGRANELRINWRDDDKRIFYELESIDEVERNRIIFTITTKKWLSVTKQSWN